MYIIVAGGGKVGRNLTEALIKSDHEVLLIERNAAKVELYKEQFGEVVTQGDACEAQVLADAGANRADVVVAVTGDDEDNLVICQMAKRKFGTKRVVARVNNPKNEKIFKKLGVDVTLNSTNLLLNMITQEIATRSIYQLLKVRDSGFQLVDVIIGTESPAATKPVNDLQLPPETKLLIVVRDGHTIVPFGDTQLAANDEVICITPQQSEQTVRRILVGN